MRESLLIVSLVSLWLLSLVARALLELWVARLHDSGERAGKRCSPLPAPPARFPAPPGRPLALSSRSPGSRARRPPPM